MIRHRLTENHVAGPLVGGEDQMAQRLHERPFVIDPLMQGRSGQPPGTGNGLRSRRQTTWACPRSRARTRGVRPALNRRIYPVLGPGLGRCRLGHWRHWPEYIGRWCQRPIGHRPRGVRDTGQDHRAGGQPCLADWFAAHVARTISGHASCQPQAAARASRWARSLVLAVIAAAR